MPLSILAILTLTGCGPNWQPMNPAQPRTLDPGAVLEFRARDQLVRLHGVRFERDSLSGIPWLEHLSCDACRVRYALTGVSEARTGNPGAGAWNIMLPYVLVVGFLYAAFSQLPST